MVIKRTLAMVIACALMLAVPVVALANGISPRYSYTSSVVSGLEISASGVAKCSGRIRVYDSGSTISMKVSLYQKIGNSWDRVTSWYGSSTGNSYLAMTKTYQLSEYGTYKVLVTGTVTAAGGGSEWISLESTHMTYP